MYFNFFKWMEMADPSNQSPFQKLYDLFKELLLISSGDVAQAIKWLEDIDRKYRITNQFKDYDINDFIQELEDKGFIKADDDHLYNITSKTEIHIRQSAFEHIFKNPNKGPQGFHRTSHQGRGKEHLPETRAFQFGDDLSYLDHSNTLLNTFKRTGNTNDFDIAEDDIRIRETDHHSSIATVLLIDLSHSMVLYGEDRITPAKKVALALSELILNEYKNDSLHIVAFGNEAWEIDIKDLPYLQVGPFHTNTKAALELARSILNRKKNSNKQICMITDGKPSCMFENGQLYTNSFGLDPKIINKVLDEAMACKKAKIPITTFMIAKDPYLQNFVRDLTEVNQGRAYFASPNEVGKFILEDYIQNRRKKL